MATTTLIDSQDDRPPNTQMDSVEGYAQEQAQQSEADVLTGLRALERAESVRWNIYRINDPDPARNGFLQTWGTAQLSQEALRDHFGAGTYRVRGHYPNGTFATQRDIPVAADAPRRQLMGAGHGSGSGNNAVQNEQSVQSLLLVLDERDQRRRAEERAAKDDDKTFWKDMAKLMAPILAPKILDVLTGSGKNTVKEIADTLMALQVNQSNKGSSVKETIELMMLMRDFDSGGSKNPGEKGIWDALTELAKSAGPKLGGILETLQNAKPIAPYGGVGTLSPMQSGAPVVAPVLLPVNATDSASVSTVADASGSPSSQPSLADRVRISQTSSVSPTSSLSEESSGGSGGGDMNLMWLRLIPFMKQQLQFLLEKAFKNSDPALYAELLLDNFPDGIKPDDLVDFLKRDDWWNSLVAFDPRVQNYPGWFSQLRSELIEQHSSNISDNERKPDTDASSQKAD